MDGTGWDGTGKDRAGREGIRWDRTGLDWTDIINKCDKYDNCSNNNDNKVMSRRLLTVLKSTSISKFTTKWFIKNQNTSFEMH